MTPYLPSVSQTNSLVDQSSTSGGVNGVFKAIKAAAQKTGVDFSYLLQKASQESGFDPNAQATTSSATGLYQFTSQTWLKMIKDKGTQYGLGAYANQIKIDNESGVAKVDSPAWRSAILDLRKNPEVSAEMAGELDKQNFTSLKENVGGKIGSTELYLAHFLGASGASNFLQTMKANPNETAAAVLPDAAQSNPSVFYNASGQPKSLAQIYNYFAKKFGGVAAPTMLASNPLPTQTPSLQKPSTAFTYAVAKSDPSSYLPISQSNPMTASYSNALTSGIKSTSSSLYATMVLAQMNVDGLSSLSALGTVGQNNHSKKDALSMLSETSIG